MSLSCAGASVSLDFKNPCSTARLPGSERSLCSLEEFQGRESAALTDPGIDHSSGPLSWFLQATWEAWLRQGCADIAMKILL